MCAPTCRGGAYLAASVFIYRSILLVVNSIASGITGYKMTYLNVPFLEEFMLHVIYFIPLFTSSGFALMGVEEDSFNFVFYSALSLATTLFIRYTAELAYIYAFDWSAFRMKTPSLFLNIFVDSIFVLTLLIYACQELRGGEKTEKTELEGSSHHSAKRDVTTRQRRTQVQIADTPGSPPGQLISSTPTNNSNIHNEFERKNVKNSNLEAAAVTDRSNMKKKSAFPRSSRVGIGYGAQPGEALHYPITPIDKRDRTKALPALPAPGTLDESTELDDISLPPPIPLASPEYDEMQQ